MIEIVVVAFETLFLSIVATLFVALVKLRKMNREMSEELGRYKTQNDLHDELHQTIKRTIDL